VHVCMRVRSKVFTMSDFQAPKRVKYRGNYHESLLVQRIWGLGFRFGFSIEVSIINLAGLCTAQISSDESLNVCHIYKGPTFGRVVCSTNMEPRGDLCSKEKNPK